MTRRDQVADLSGGVPEVVASALLVRCGGDAVSLRRDERGLRVVHLDRRRDAVFETVAREVELLFREALVLDGNAGALARALIGEDRTAHILFDLPLGLDRLEVDLAAAALRLGDARGDVAARVDRNRDEAHDLSRPEEVG